MNESDDRKTEDKRSRKRKQPENGPSARAAAGVRKPPVWWYPVSVLARLLVFLFATVIVSVVYKGLIEMEFFQIIPSGAFQLFFFCLFELFLLGMYWHYTFLFSKECRHRSPSLLSYYLMTAAVFLLFTAVYLTVYFKMDSSVFQWAFRVTLNLCGLRLSTTFPENLLPYMAGYLIGTFLIMMLEPPIAIRRYHNYIRRLNGYR